MMPLKGNPRGASVFDLSERLLPETAKTAGDWDKGWLDNFGLPEQQIFGCMTETALLGLEGRNESFSRGDIGLDRVEEMLALAMKHDFGLS